MSRKEMDEALRMGILLVKESRGRCGPDDDADPIEVSFFTEGERNDLTQSTVGGSVDA